MPGAQHHSQEVKARIVAAIFAGKALADISREFGVSKQTVSRIKKEIPERELGQIGTNSRHRLEDLLIDALAANITGEKVFLETCCNAAYIQSQSAEHLAELFTAFTNRSTRILEAAGALLGATPDQEDA